MSTITLKVDGVASVIRQLGQIDPELRKAATHRMRSVAEPVAARARGFIPTATPLSGWARSKRLGWSSARVKAGIKPRVSTRANRSSQIGLLSVVQTNPAGAMFDMAGKRGGTSPKGQQFVKSLAERTGQPSRSMWPGVQAAMPLVEDQLRAAVGDLEDTLNAVLGRDR